MSFHLEREITADFATIRDSASVSVPLTGSGAVVVPQTVVCSRLGNQVIIQLPMLTATGSSASIVLTGLPAQFIPLSDVVFPVIANFGTNPGNATVTTAGVITIIGSTGMVGGNYFNPIALTFISA